MRTPFLIVFITLFTWLNSAYAQTGILFESDSFSILLSKARQQHKFIFIDCYTTWCGPCKWMDKNVYTNDTVADFYNANFICTKIDMEKGEGIELLKRYDVHCYPTFLFIDSTGTVVHRKSGAQKVQAFVDIGKETLIPEDRFLTQQKAYESNKLSPPELLQYITARKSSCLPVEEEIDGYFTKDTTNLYQNAGTWFLLRDFVITPHSTACTYLMTHRKEFEARYTADSVDQILERSYMNAMGICLYSKGGSDTTKYKALRAELIEKRFSFSERLALTMDLYYYQVLMDWNGYARTAMICVPKYFHDDAFMLNNVAWAFYENISDTVQLDSAISWAARSVILQTNYFNTDTHAALLYKRGRKKEAKVQAERSIALAKQANEHPDREKNGYPLIDYSTTEELLEKIKAMK